MFGVVSIIKSINAAHYIKYWLHLYITIFKKNYTSNNFKSKTVKESAYSHALDVFIVVIDVVEIKRLNHGVINKRHY